MRGHRRAATAVAVIVVLVIIDLVVVGLVISGTRGHDLTLRRMETVEAFYAAEAGMNMAMREVMVDEDQDGDCSIGTISHDGDSGTDPAFGNAAWLVTATTSGCETTLRSYGRSGDARRQAVAVVNPSAGDGITYDNASSDMSSGVTTLTFNHTIGSGCNRLLVVCIATEEDSPDADAVTVTYNGVAMTPAVEHTPAGGTQMQTEIWYMLETDLPVSGTYPVFIECPAMSGSSNINGGAISVSGAKQQGPEATAVNDDGSAGDSTISTNITTLTDGAWIFECIGSGDSISGFTADSGQTERFDQLGGSSRCAGSTQQKAIAGLETQDWSADSSSNRLSHVLAAFAPQ
ncbi:MAG: hypothetical protein ACYSU7_00340 [Planctomycetota bacterium]|jgi:hypothetical protein